MSILVLQSSWWGGGGGGGGWLLCFICLPSVSWSVTLFTDKNRQEPTRTDKSRQEAFLCIFRLKYSLLDHMFALYIQISHMIAFAAPKNFKFQHSKLPYLPTRSFVRLSWRYTLAVTGTLVLYKKLHRSESISSFAIT